MDEKNITKVASAIDRAGAAGINRTLLQRATQLMTYEAREAALRHLIESGEVVGREVKRAAGRPALIYWHAKHAPPEEAAPPPPDPDAALAVTAELIRSFLAEDGALTTDDIEALLEGSGDEPAGLRARMNRVLAGMEAGGEVRRSDTVIGRHSFALITPLKIVTKEIAHG